MKKAIFTFVAITAMCSLIAIPEKITLFFFVDYILRLFVLFWAADNLCKIDKKEKRA